MHDNIRFLILTFFIFLLAGLSTAYCMSSLWVVHPDCSTMTSKHLLDGTSKGLVSVVGEVDRTIFKGNYSASNDEDGSEYRLEVEVEEGKLVLTFFPGGTAGYTYRETAIEEKQELAEYLVSSDDIDENGALAFLFRRNPEGRVSSVVVSWLDDSDMEPIVLIFN